MPPFSLIAAISHDGAIGQQGGLPWPALRNDRAWFRSLTQSEDPLLLAQAWCVHIPQVAYWPAEPDNAVIMGRTTYKSLPKPLAGRESIILTSEAPPLYESYDGHIWRATLFDDALTLAHSVVYAPHVWVIGGAQVYAEALQHPDCTTMFLTEVDSTYPEADTFWPESHIAWAMGRMQTWGDTRKKARAWHRTHSSAWITEPERPRYRFGIWAPA